MENKTTITILIASVVSRSGSILQLKQKDGTELTGFLPKKLHGINLPEAPEFIEFTGETKEFTSGTHAGKTLFSIYKVNGQSWAKSEGGKGVNSAPKAPKAPKVPKEPKVAKEPKRITDLVEIRKHRIYDMHKICLKNFRDLFQRDEYADLWIMKAFDRWDLGAEYKKFNVSARELITTREENKIIEMMAIAGVMANGVKRGWEKYERSKKSFAGWPDIRVASFADIIKEDLIDILNFREPKFRGFMDLGDHATIAKKEKEAEREEAEEKIGEEAKEFGTAEEPAPAQEPEAPAKAQEAPKPVETATEVPEQPETAPEEPKEPEAPATEVPPAPAIELETEATDPIGAMLAMAAEEPEEDPQDPQETPEAPAPEIKPELTDLAEINREIKKLRRQNKKYEDAIAENKRRIRELVLKEREIQEAQRRKAVEEAKKALEAAKKKAEEARKAAEDARKVAEAAERAAKEAEAREEEARRKLAALNKKPEPNEDPEDPKDPEDKPEENSGPDQAPDSGSEMETAPETKPTQTMTLKTWNKWGRHMRNAIRQSRKKKTEGNDGNEGGQSQNNGGAGNPGSAEGPSHGLEGDQAAPIAPATPEAPEVAQIEPIEVQIEQLPAKRVRYLPVPIQAIEVEHPHARQYFYKGGIRHEMAEEDKCRQVGNTPKEHEILQTIIKYSQGVGLSRGYIKIPPTEAFKKEMKFREDLKRKFEDVYDAYAEIERLEDQRKPRKPKGLCREFTEEEGDAEEVKRDQERRAKRKAQRKTRNNGTDGDNGTEGGQSQNNGGAGNPGSAEGGTHALEGAQVAAIAPEVAKQPENAPEEPAKVQEPEQIGHCWIVPGEFTDDEEDDYATEREADFNDMLKEREEFYQNRGEPTKPIEKWEPTPELKALIDEANLDDENLDLGRPYTEKKMNADIQCKIRDFYERMARSLNEIIEEKGRQEIDRIYGWKTWEERIKRFELAETSGNEDPKRIAKEIRYYMEKFKASERKFNKVKDEREDGDNGNDQGQNNGGAGNPGSAEGPSHGLEGAQAAPIAPEVPEAPKTAKETKKKAKEKPKAAKKKDQGPAMKKVEELDFGINADDLPGVAEEYYKNSEADYLMELWQEEVQQEFSRLWNIANNEFISEKTRIKLIGEWMKNQNPRNIMNSTTGAWIQEISRYNDGRLSEKAWNQVMAIINQMLEVATDIADRKRWIKFLDKQGIKL